MISRIHLLIVGGALFCAADAFATPRECVADITASVLAAGRTVTGSRPEPSERLFRSEAVEATIRKVTAALQNRKLAEMFENCFPNTLDTTVKFRTDEQGNPDTFVITGDINAMWLRDSSAQVWPYMSLIACDEPLRLMIEGVIRRQLKCIILDPYANAFNDGPTGGEWQSDWTKMIPEVHERKWEIDSLCYPLRLAYEYWKRTGDISLFQSPEWSQALALILQTFREQQRKEGGNTGPYRFLRTTDRALDTLNNVGWGAPVSGCGLIVSSFRPSDDATTLQYLVPSNFFAVTSLRQAAEINDAAGGDASLSAECRELADEVSAALDNYAVVQTPDFGKIYAFEVDGFGNSLLMDDANAPSLLSLPYLSDVPVDSPVYQATRSLIWSPRNPYFFRGKVAEGIGGPHVGYDMAWPMSLTMRALTSDSDEEILDCLDMLLATDAGTGFIHESFNVDDPSQFTREWFAWQNGLFGELILKLFNEGKIDLLNQAGQKAANL
ncbi:MAG: glycoside hydrolase family 125 protein [Paramuribaculum sp.]|nr:glycoside hydrolase family 125 protein [Paramuribaculum sp.]